MLGTVSRPQAVFDHKLLYQRIVLGSATQQLSYSSPTSKMLSARGVGHGLTTSSSLRPQTTVSTDCPWIRHPATQLQQPYFKDVICKGCWARSHDLKQSSTTNYCINGLSLDPPPSNSATKILPYCDQLLGLVGAVKGKTCSSIDFTIGTTHLSRQCSCFLNNNSSYSITSISHDGNIGTSVKNVLDINSTSTLFSIYCHINCEASRVKFL